MACGVCIFSLAWGWPDPLPIHYVGKGLGTSVHPSRVNKNWMGVGVICHKTQLNEVVL